MTSPDGAHLGMGAEDALDAVLGGDQEESKPRRVTAAEMREKLEAAPLTGDLGYSECADACGRLVLEYLDRHPEARSLGADGVREWPKNKDGSTDWDGIPKTVIEGIDDHMRRVEPEWYASHKDVWDELTGFMWGWAVNAARYASDLPPVPNPAIVTIGGGS